MTGIFALIFVVVSGSKAFLFGDDEICCNGDGVGCFRKEGAFSHLPLPECPADMHIELGLFTRANTQQPVFFNDNIPKELDSQKRTVFVVHGYMSDFNTKWLHEIKDSLLQAEDANVVLVGWDVGASNVYYPQSASNTRTVGAALALQAHKMRETASSADIWCVGFSLGAHLCGHMGARVHLQRITGLDPAGPSFDSYDLDVGLHAGRADFVDVMHTDGKGLLAYYGTLKPLGDVDYYPNGGYDQPGCFTRRDVSARLDQHVTLDDRIRVQKVIDYGQAVQDGIVLKGEGISCSHSRAPKYFEATIKQDCFIATHVCTNYEEIPESCVKCDGLCGMMGYQADKYSTTGLLYLETTGNKPYCLQK